MRRDDSVLTTVAPPSITSADPPLAKSTSDVIVTSEHHEQQGISKQKTQPEAVQSPPPVTSSSPLSRPVETHSICNVFLLLLFLIVLLASHIVLHYKVREFFVCILKKCAEMFIGDLFGSQ